MVVLSGLILVVIAFIFAYLYTKEPIFEFKWLWLFTSLATLTIAGPANQILSTITTSGSTFTLNYILDPTLQTISGPFGYLFLAIIIIFAFKMIISAWTNRDRIKI